MAEDTPKVTVTPAPVPASAEPPAVEKKSVVFNRTSFQLRLELKDGQSTFVPPNGKTPPILTDNIPEMLPQGLLKTAYVPK